MRKRYIMRLVEEFSLFIFFLCSLSASSNYIIFYLIIVIYLSFI